MKPKTKQLMYAEGWLSIAINITLFMLKYWAGIATGSVAILADAWHTLSDCITSIMVIVGAKLSSRPADADHPFGHGRAEIIVSIIIGVLLAVVGFNFFVESAQKLRENESANFNTLAAVVFALSVVLKEAITQFSFWAGKKTGARSLIADGWHHRSDSVASALIFLGILVGRYIWWIDAVLGIAVSILILYAAYSVIREGVDPLLGERPDEKLLEHVNQLGHRLTGTRLDIHHVHIHNYGNHKEITFHMRVDEVSLNRGHWLATEMENAIRDELSMEATIHVEPLKGH
jgi:cation diffusion facilitator family transporter